MARVRTASPSDMAAFNAIMSDATPQNWPALMSASSRCLLAESSLDESPVGLIEAHRAGDDIEIIMIATHHAARRQGIAQILLNALFDRARSEGAARVILDVAVDNCAARQLYAKTGFQEIARRKNYYRSNATRQHRDALLLVRCFASAKS